MIDGNPECHLLRLISQSQQSRKSKKRCWRRACWKAINLQLITKSALLHFRAFQRSRCAAILHRLAGIMWALWQLRSLTFPLRCRKNLFRSPRSEVNSTAEHAIAGVLWIASRRRRGCLWNPKWRFSPSLVVWFAASGSLRNRLSPPSKRSMGRRCFYFFSSNMSPGHWIYNETPFICAEKRLTWTHHKRCR